MKEMMQQMREAALRAIQESKDAESLESLRIRYLGKKGELTGKAFTGGTAADRSAG